jgi:CubicO group peptidase (beta-lactamase class C family)
MRCLPLIFLVACTSSSGTPRYAGIVPALARGDAPKTTSVLVMRHGAIEYERYFDGANVDTLHDTRSATKSVTALAVGIAIDRKLVASVTAPAFRYLADLEPLSHDDALKQAITIEDLLTMSSALACDDDDDASPGNEDHMHPQPVWTRWAADLPTRADYTRDAEGRGPWHYCTASAFLLGQIVQRAAKQPIDRFIEDQLFAPLGIAKSEFPRSPAGEVMTGGGLRLRTRDLAAFGWLVRSQGAWRGKQVVSAEFVRAATTTHRHADVERGLDYGYLFWHRQFKTPCGATSGWFMSGNGGNAVVILAELDTVIAVTRTLYNTHGMHEQTDRLIEEQIIPEISCDRAR